MEEDAIEAGGLTCRHFVTYTGIDLPFRLVGPIGEDQVENRNTFIRAWFDREERLAGFDKLVYGEIELAHRYRYHGSGALAQADLEMCDEDAVTLHFDETGSLVPVRSVALSPR